MMNFARFIPGTPDADYMRQQVSERGVLENIDALNEVVKGCFGEGQPISDFYKMIADIEDNLNKNMNDPRAKSLVNTFPEASKTEVKVETPKAPVVDKKDTPDENDNDKPDTTDQPVITDDTQSIVENPDNDDDGNQKTGDNTEGTGTMETPAGNETQAPEGTGEGTENSDTDGDPAGTEDNTVTEHPTRRSRKKSGDAE